MVIEPVEVRPQCQGPDCVGRTIQAKGVHLVSFEEQLNTSTGKLLLTLMSTIAQFERDIIADRTHEELRSAISRGRT